MGYIPGTKINTLELPPNPPGDEDPCWCRSQVPYGKCHKHRHEMQPESRWTILKRVRKLMDTSYCSHPDASPATCTGRVVKAHSLQRSGSLSRLAVDGHVYGLDAKGMPDDRGIFPFVRIGLNRASTFTGFCQRHDTEMFAPLETKPFTAKKEQLFLLAYRAVAKEAFAKRFGIRMLPILRLADVGKEPFEQYLVQEQLYQHEQLQSLSLRDLETTMKDYAAIYRSGDFDRMSAYVVFADRKIGFATSGGVHPEFDFEGNSLEALASTDRLDQLTYSAIPFDDGSVFAFVWDWKAGKSCIRLMQSLDRFSNDDLANALIRMTFEHFENTFADPRWWESLTPQERDALERRIGKAASQENREPGCLKEDGLRVARWKIVASQWL
jgi:hypothetical protein